MDGQHLLTASSHGGDGGGGGGGITLYLPTGPPIGSGLYSLNLNNLLKASSPSIVRWGLGLQHLDLGVGGTHSSP